MAEIYWRFKELQAGKIQDFSSDQSLAMSRGHWDLENLSIDSQAPASRPHVTGWFKDNEEVNMPGISAMVDEWMLAHYSKNILTDNVRNTLVPKDAHFVLITNSVNRNDLQQWGYDANTVARWDIPDPWMGSKEGYVKTWDAIRKSVDGLWAKVYPAV